MDAPAHRRKDRSLLAALNIDDEEIGNRKRFLQFGDDDVARLKSIGELSERYADEVIEEFYRHLLSFEETRVFFSDPEVLARVKNAQKNYFVRLTEGNYDTDYIENRLKVGSVHERISLPMKAYLGMYNFYLRTVFARLSETYRDEPERAFSAFLSLMKLTFLDIGLAIDTYIESRERTIGRQQEAIKELSTPVLPFRDGILLLPVIGMIDSFRAAQLTEQLLHSIRDTRSKVVVVDITGVPYVDSRVASHLVQTVEAARLMGSRVIVSGVSPDIALTMVTLGIDLGRIETVGDMQSGLELAERLAGYKMVRVETEAR
ncbi:MAG TPA: protoglobin domain-containing protein [Noviherbaspirillum sp.]|uniref:protoglobin domain-containing protein n=1 Tax=Noviherbaspirillum sp. TaxID=1926288 RepID=UPI002D4FE3B9|nr:protoglobin domain-containing protein [Noviherbaspirillum sp.]HYD94151.1 protoglobin domain-containing protein [Noviherbaspirillum sp.]